MRIRYWYDSNFNTRGLRGNNFELLPFVRLFLPYPTTSFTDERGQRRRRTDGRWTLHVGWLAWTLGVHFDTKQVAPSPR